jgi:hypothetical protein
LGDISSVFIQNICPAHPCTSPFLPFLKDKKNSTYQHK